MDKNNESKNWLSEMINKIKKTLVRRLKDKGEYSQVTSSGMKEETSL